MPDKGHPEGCSSVGISLAFSSEKLLCLVSTESGAVAYKQCVCGVFPLPQSAAALITISSSILKYLVPRRDICDWAVFCKIQ